MNDIELQSIERLRVALKNPERADVNPRTIVRGSLIFKFLEVFRFTLSRFGLSINPNIRKPRPNKSSLAIK